MIPQQAWPLILGVVGTGAFSVAGAFGVAGSLGLRFDRFDRGRFCREDVVLDDTDADSGPSPRRRVSRGVACSRGGASNGTVSKYAVSKCAFVGVLDGDLRWTR